MTTITTTKHKCWQGYREIRSLAQCWWECRMVQPLWKTVYRFCKKLQTELPYHPALPFLGIHPKVLKSGSQRDISTPMFTAAPFTIAKIQKQFTCLATDEWIKKMCYIHTVEYYSD